MLKQRFPHQQTARGKKKNQKKTHTYRREVKYNTSSVTFDAYIRLKKRLTRQPARLRVADSCSICWDPKAYRNTWNRGSSLCRHTSPMQYRNLKKMALYASSQLGKNPKMQRLVFSVNHLNKWLTLSISSGLWTPIKDKFIITGQPTNQLLSTWYNPITFGVQSHICLKLYSYF